MKRLAVVLFASISFAVVAGAVTPEPMSRFTRPDQGLRLVERSDSFTKGSYAVWAGRITLTGKLIIEFDRTPTGDAEQDAEGFAYFEPDQVSRSRLPRAVGSFYPLEPKVISFETSASKILPQLLGAAKANLVLTGSEPRYEVPVRIVLKRLRTDVECDHRSFGAEFASISLLAKEIVAMGQAKDFGC